MNTGVLTAVGGAAALAAIAEGTRGRVPSAAIVVGGAVVAIGLSALGAGRPALANQFAALILITSLMIHGATLAAALNRYFQREEPPQS